MNETFDDYMEKYRSIKIKSIQLTLSEFYCNVCRVVNSVDYIVFVIKEMGYPFLLSKSYQREKSNRRKRE